MSLKNPVRNTELPVAVQKRLNEMYSRETGFSGSQILEFFSQYSLDIEHYPWGGGAPSRWQIFEDCLARFEVDQQKRILSDLLAYDGRMSHGHPKQEDVDWIRRWLTEGGVSQEPDRSLRRVVPSAQPTPSSSQQGSREVERPCDCFLSHASEDKAAIARPLYEALTRAGVSVWFDEAVLELGDSLRRKIDGGLVRCRYGIVILSPMFFAKQWPQRELDGLVARETASGEKAILPIWHELDHEEVARHSPTLADRVAGRSTEGVQALVDKIMRVLRQ